MNLYYAIVIVSIIAFIICIFYYKILFRHPINQEAKSQHMRNEHKIILWAIAYINILTTCLIYTTFGYTLKIFILASSYMPYFLSLLLWLSITASLITSASRTKQTLLITYIHSGYWLVTLILYALLFPLVTT